MNTNFKVIGLTRLGIKPESRAPEVDGLTIRPSELLSSVRFATARNLTRYLASMTPVRHRYKEWLSLQCE